MRWGCARKPRRVNGPFYALQPSTFPAYNRSPMPCRVCRADVPDGSRFCPSCGASIDMSEAHTVAPPPVVRPPSTGSLDEARFVPGTMLAGRYRIVALLGKGGMGEVYRAEDLTLGQPVALKFLPDEVANDPDRLARFRQEVRLARQVSHPNVCRVYDIGDANGQPFLSMEYVNGEDLASLLRRIGRLPSAKATELARQVCAGLAAAHDRGVLHRDLKPANVLIDERGRARIADFGLAGLADVEADRDRGVGIIMGTPGYMAPEQLAGQGTSTRSDVYALGLVLYELFTGKPAHALAKAGGRVAFEHPDPPTNPSTIVADIDPAIERVILRCLEHDPARRPSSAIAVASALPGGDPLAAALAAGETPSPEMVAAAAETDRLSMRTIGIYMVSIAVGLVAAAILGAAEPIRWSRRRPISRRRRSSRRHGSWFRSFGYEEPPVDRAYGLCLRRLPPLDERQRATGGLSGAARQRPTGGHYCSGTVKARSTSKRSMASAQFPSPTRPWSSRAWSGSTWIRRAAWCSSTRSRRRSRTIRPRHRPARTGNRC